jgi:hypothetical protein
MTRPNVKRRKLSDVVVTVLLMFLLHGVANGQEANKEKGEIMNVEANETVSVEFDVRAADKVVVVPHCGQDLDTGHALCSGVAYLEVLNGKTWTRAKPRKGLLGVLGVPSKDEFKPVTIAPGRTEHFVFVFSPGLFGIQKGERMRIKVGVWTSEEAMRDHDEDTTFPSPVFSCP